MTPQLTAAIARLKEKGDAFGKALAQEQTLERQRPLLKEMAIRRIMERDKCSATAAKDIANSDLEYMNHKVAQGEAVVAHYRAEAEYEAAKAEACQAALITPTVIELEVKIAKWARLIDDANVTLTEARKMNAELFRRIEEQDHANADLVQANRDLAQQIERLTLESQPVVGRA